MKRRLAAKQFLSQIVESAAKRGSPEGFRMRTGGWKESFRTSTSRYRRSSQSYDPTISSYDWILATFLVGLFSLDTPTRPCSPAELTYLPFLVLICLSPFLLFFLVLATKEGLFTNHFTFNLPTMTFPLCSFFLFFFFFDPAVRSSGKFASDEQSRELPGSCINLPYRDHGNSCSFL